MQLQINIVDLVKLLGVLNKPDLASQVASSLQINNSRLNVTTKISLGTVTFQSTLTAIQGGLLVSVDSAKLRGLSLFGVVKSKIKSTIINMLAPYEAVQVQDSKAGLILHLKGIVILAASILGEELFLTVTIQ